MATVSTPNDSPVCTMAFVLIPRFNMTALTSSLEPLRIANYIAGNTLYAWQFLSAEGGIVVPSNDMPLATKPLKYDDFRWDTVYVCGSWNSEHYENTGLFNWLRHQDRLGITLGAMCIGTYVLARAKLLSGYRATLHWSCIQGFAERYPHIQTEEQLFVVDRNRITTGGGTAGVDLMLYDIQQRHGPQLALEVADQLLHHPIRAPAAPQRHSHRDDKTTLPHPLSEAIRLMENNLEEPLPIPYIADVINVSQRKLERLFKRHTHTSAIGFYRTLRLQFARVLLTQTSFPIREVSVACGFASFSHFAKSFIDQFGKRPRDYRHAWPESDMGPDWPGMTASLSKFTDTARNWQKKNAAEKLAERRRSAKL